MLVTRKNLDQVIEQLHETDTYGIDTEATGLQAYKQDRLFSLIISSHSGNFYFNFLQYPDLDDAWTLPREETFRALRPIFESPDKRWYIQNAKFDLAILNQESVSLAGEVWDTEVGARIIYNRHMKYGLDALAKRRGLEKDSAVEDYIKKNRVYTWLFSPRGQKKAKQPHYDRVPHAIMSKYGEKDGELVLVEGEHQRREIEDLAKIVPGDRLKTLMANELQLTKVCFEMEKIGIKIDKSYCETAFEHEVKIAEEAAGKFKSLSGFDFVDSGKSLAKAFDAVGEKYPTTKKGNPSFKQDVLEGFTSPLAQLVLDQRRASKKAGTYYDNFLYYADDMDRIHPNMRQAGTDTGRFSYSEPNLQNVPKDEKGLYTVRKAFIPTSDEWFFAMFDYDQMEYRLLLEYACEMGVIADVLRGLDVHEATAKMMGVSRQEAKTLNFMLLYGGGTAKLASALGIPLEKAAQLKHRYFKKLMKIRAFTKRVQNTAEGRGFVFNWAGRVCHFPLMMNGKTGKMDRFAYRAPNHIIQGGCADVVRRAMVDIHRYLQGKRSRLLLTVHDEVLLEIHRDECNILADVKQLMEKAYPHKYLPLTCGVEIGIKSWGHKIEVPKKLLTENLELGSLLALSN